MWGLLCYRPRGLSKVFVCLAASFSPNPWHLPSTNPELAAPRLHSSWRTPVAPMELGMGQVTNSPTVTTDRDQVGLINHPTNPETMHHGGTTCTISIHLLSFKGATAVPFPQRPETAGVAPSEPLQLVAFALGPCLRGRRSWLLGWLAEIGGLVVEVGGLVGWWVW